jgi:hypothetical protein
MANATMVAIREVFGERIISRGLLSPRSPDLIFCNIYFLGNLKGKVYKNNLCSTEILQNDIICHFFINLDTHNFMETGESGYLWQNLQIHFL